MDGQSGGSPGSEGSEGSEEERCRRLYLALLTRDPEWRACVRLRELARTAACDRVHDLSAVRSSHEAAVGAAGMRRIADYRETAEDEHRAAAALARLRGRTEAALCGGLGWRDWLWFHGVHRFDRLALDVLRKVLP